MWKWIKIPKGIALLAFLLPWMTVSCSGNKMVEASGLQLVTGNIKVMGQAAGNGDANGMNWFLLLAVAAITVGLVLAFIKGREAAKLLLGTSIAALVLVFVGTRQYSTDAIMAKAAESEAGKGMDQAMLAMIEINWEIGYWVCLLALLVAAIFSWLVMVGKDDEAEAKMRSVAANVTDAAKDAANKASDVAKDAADKAGDAIEKATKRDDPPKE